VLALSLVILRQPLFEAPQRQVSSGSGLCFAGGWWSRRVPFPLFVRLLPCLCFGASALLCLFAFGFAVRLFGVVFRPSLGRCLLGFSALLLPPWWTRASASLSLVSCTAGTRVLRVQSWLAFCSFAGFCLLLCSFLLGLRLLPCIVFVFVAGLRFRCLFGGVSAIARIL